MPISQSQGGMQPMRNLNQYSNQLSESRNREDVNLQTQWAAHESPGIKYNGTF